MQAQNENEGGPAAHLLSTPSMAQVHYTQQRLSRDPLYEGPAEMWGEEEAAAVLTELLRYFGCSDIPPPPRGLPGALAVATSDGEMRTLQLGVNYLAALADRRPRRQIRFFQEAGQIVRDAYHAGHEAHLQEALAKQAARAVVALTSEREEIARRVYYIGADSGPIKIGVATDPSARLKGLQTAHHEKLQILATAPGGIDREAAYHLQFAAHRLHGEWFERHPDILAEIDRLNSTPSRERLSECRRVGL